MKTVRKLLEDIWKSDDPEFDMEHIEPRIVKTLDDLCSAVDGLKPRDDKSLTIAVYIQALEDVKAMIRK